MAYPIKTYANIYDTTYGRVPEGQPRGHFGHLIIRDSNTVGKDYLLIGLNSRDDTGLDEAIRLNKKQVKQIIRALRNWLTRIGEEVAKSPTRPVREDSSSR